MYRHVLAWFAAVFLALAPTAWSAPVSEFQYLRDVTVKVGGGSGVKIQADYVLTAQHVVEGFNFVRIDKKYDGRVVYQDANRDLALLYVDGLNCPCIDVIEKRPAVDTPVIAVGFPMFESLGVQFLTEGRFMGIIDNIFEPVVHGKYAHSAPIYYGNSGGGLYVKDALRNTWMLLGINVYTFGYQVPAQHLAGATGNEDIRKFLIEYWMKDKP